MHGGLVTPNRKLHTHTHILSRPGLCLFCYQPSCVVSQQSWFGLFLFHKFSDFTPPPQPFVISSRLMSSVYPTDHCITVLSEMTTEDSGRDVKKITNVGRYWDPLCVMVCLQPLPACHKSMKMSSYNHRTIHTIRCFKRRVVANRCLKRRVVANLLILIISYHIPYSHIPGPEQRWYLSFASGADATHARGPALPLQGNGGSRRGFTSCFQVPRQHRQQVG